MDSNSDSETASDYYREILKENVYDHTFRLSFTNSRRKIDPQRPPVRYNETKADKRRPYFTEKQALRLVEIRKRQVLK